MRTFQNWEKWEFRRMIILLCILVIIVLCSCLFFTETIWYDKKHGMKYTLTDSSFTAEWDYSSPLTMLKLTKLFIQGELDTEKRKKYIRQYNRLKEYLKDKYDMSDFPDYKDWDDTKMKLIKTKLLIKHNHNSAVGIATASHIDFCKW